MKAYNGLYVDRKIESTTNPKELPHLKAGDLRAVTEPIKAARRPTMKWLPQGSDWNFFQLCIEYNLYLLASSAKSFCGLWSAVPSSVLCDG